MDNASCKIAAAAKVTLETLGKITLVPMLMRIETPIVSKKTNGSIHDSVVSNSIMKMIITATIRNDGMSPSALSIIAFVSIAVPPK